jgi:putrescine transport system substrate-binding protein
LFSQYDSFKASENRISARMRLFYLLMCCLIGLFPTKGTAQKTVNVYSWAYSIPQVLLEKFEQETGIAINYDVYDSPEVMETKLLAGSSGYDVVMVTVWPYLVRQREAHLYQPLSRTLLFNWGLLDPILLARMEDADPGNQFAVPFLWGTSGFAFNRQMIQKRFPDAPTQSWAMLFDPAVLANFADCGVLLLDSPNDAMPAVLQYLSKDPASNNAKDLKEGGQQLLAIRPFVRKFQPMSSAGDLLSQDYCLVEGFSGELLQAQKMGKENGVDIQYVIPEEGAALWVDALAIPQDAPHVKEAHAFINFMLRPENIAKVTEAIETANSVPTSLPLLPKAIAENPLIFPPQEILEKLYVDKAHSPQYERLRLREWTRVKIGR